MGRPRKNFTPTGVANNQIMEIPRPLDRWAITDYELVFWASTGGPELRLRVGDGLVQELKFDGSVMIGNVELRGVVAASSSRKDGE